MIYYVLLFVLLFAISFIATIFEIMADRNPDRKDSFDPLMMMRYNELSSHLHHNNFNIHYL